jgi:hypothetical protein
VKLLLHRDQFILTSNEGDGVAIGATNGVTTGAITQGVTSPQGYYFFLHLNLASLMIITL